LGLCFVSSFSPPREAGYKAVPEGIVGKAAYTVVEVHSSNTAVAAAAAAVAAALVLAAAVVAATVAAALAAALAAAVAVG